MHLFPVKKHVKEKQTDFKLDRDARDSLVFLKISSWRSFQFFRPLQNTNGAVFVFRHNLCLRGICKWVFKLFIMPGGHFKSLRSLNCPSCLDHLHCKRAATEEGSLCTGGYVKKPVLQHRPASMALV